MIGRRDLLIDRHEHLKQREQLGRERVGQLERRDALGHRMGLARGHAQPVAANQCFGQRDGARPRPHQRLPHRQFGPHVAPRRRHPMRDPIGPQPTRLHQRSRIPPVRLRPSRPRRVHRREVRIGDDYLMPQLLQMPRHPLALRARLEQNARPRTPSRAPR